MTPEELKQLREDNAKRDEAMESLSKGMKAVQDEVKKKEAGTITEAALTTVVEKVKADMDAKFDIVNEVNTKQTAALEDVEKKFAGAELIGADGKSEAEKKADSAAFKEFFYDGQLKGTSHKGSKVQMDTKTMATDDNTQGGYLTLVDISNNIDSYLREISPIEANARVIDTDAMDWEEAFKITDSQVLNTTERGTRSATTTPTYGKVVIPCHAVYAEPALTQKMVNGRNVVNVEQWLQNDVSEEFLQKLGADYVTGDGIDQAIGIISEAGRGAEVVEVNSLNAATLPTDYERFFNMVGAVKFAYGNKKWYANRTTIVELWKYSDSNNRFYISEANPMMMRGFPIVDTPDLPDVAANAYPIVFGDLRTGYAVVRNNATVFVRDEITAKGFVIYYYERYRGGGIVRPEAFVKMKISA